MQRDNFAVGIALVLDPPAHRQRVRGLIADIEEELRDLGDEPNDARLDLNENSLDLLFNS